MKTSKFSEELIIYVLHQVDGGEAVTEVCRKLGISQQTFYIWKERFGDLEFLIDAPASF